MKTKLLKAFGATVTALFLAALFVEISFAEAAASEVPTAGALDWDWATISQTPKAGCTEFENCFFIRVKKTSQCMANLNISLMFTDKHDRFIDELEAVIESPRSDKPTIIELGSEDDSVEYFYVGEVTCSSSPANYLLPI